MRYVITCGSGRAALYRLGIGRGIHQNVEWTDWWEIAIHFDSVEAAQATIDFLVGVVDADLDGELHIREDT